MKFKNSFYFLAGFTIASLLAVGAYAVQNYNQKQNSTPNYESANFALNDNRQDYKKRQKYEYSSQNNNGFDFYVLALSWSPSFCQNHPDVKGAQDQCKIGSRRGFVVHGLWPQFEHGFPRSCPSDQEGPDAGLVSQMLDIMPSPRLVRNEWLKHGTCSNLNPREYFKTLRSAYSKVKIPNISANSNQSAALIEEAFVNANPKLQNQGIAIMRENNLMSEVRICLDKNLDFRTCEEVDARSAKQFDKLYIPSPK